MYDLISIGGICIDNYFKGESLTYNKNRFQLAIGGKYLADTYHFSVGGGAANVAIAASKRNIKTAVYGLIGDNPFKYMIYSHLKENNVDYTLCPLNLEYFNISAILISPTGERSIINYVTPHVQLFQDTNHIKKLIHTKAVFLGNLPDVSLSSRVEVLSHLKKMNIITILNLGIKDCRRSINQLKELLSKIDILMCNGHEFAELVKAPYSDISFKDNIIKHYIPFLLNKTVIVTEGSRGSYAYQNSLILHQPALPVKRIVDTTGAGDSYTGAFIAEYLISRKLSHALEKGALYATHILGKIGSN